MTAHNIDILGISESHWKGKGLFQSISGNNIYFSCHAEESINEVCSWL